MAIWDHHVAIDFETYFGTGCNVRDLGISQYVKHPEFEVNLMSYRTHNMEEAECLVGHDAIQQFFDELKPHADKITLSAHNIMFDGYIAMKKFGFVPGFYLCTMAMARAVLQQFCSTSLGNVAKFLGVQEKIQGVLMNTRNKRWHELTVEEQLTMIDYCKGDTDTHYQILEILKIGFPEEELRIIDLVTRMFTVPVLQADAELATRIWENELAEKKATVEKVGVPKSVFASNDKFAALLESEGYTCPLKWSDKQEKYIPAVAIADLEFIKLEEQAIEQGDDRLLELILARKRLKSNIIETRSKAFIDRADEPVPVAINYCAAHTMRFGGGDKFNPQNLPNETDLRNCLRAPKGYKLVIVDAAQIEARINAWLAGQDDLVNQFIEGEDVYSIFASKIFGHKVTKKTHYKERYIGKTCLTGNTKVLTDRGWVPLVEVTLKDKLWDGETWVTHQGVSYMGRKKTILLYGLELTPDHEILTAPTRWEDAQSVRESTTAFQSALSLATLPSSVTRNISRRMVNTGDGNPIVNANAVVANTPTMQETFVQAAQPRATNAPKGKQETNVGGNTKQQWVTMSTGHDYSIVYQPRFPGVIIQRTRPTCITGSVTSTFAINGAKIAQHFSAMCKRWMAGISQSMKWIVSILTKVTSLETSSSSPAQKTCGTSDRSQTSKPVYDILNSGSKNRFTVLTEQGPIIVHNCILGLGYQMGAQRLKDELKRGRGGPSLVVPLSECQHYVNVYRAQYAKIQEQWFKLHMLLHTLLPKSQEIVKYRMLRFSAGQIEMPNGLSLYYPGMHPVMCEHTGRIQYFFRPHGASEPVKMFGGKLDENIVQCLARTITTGHMLELAKVYKPVLMAHDEIVLCVPESRADIAFRDALEVMEIPPPWASGLPLEAEGCIAPFYTKPD